MNYSRYVLITSAIPLALALAGCGGGAGSPGGSTAGSSPAKTIMNAYAPTPAGGTNTTINAAQKQSGGVAGFGVATSGATSAVSAVGTYVVGNVEQIDPDKLKIKIDGKEYTLSGRTSSTTGISGNPYMAYGNTAHSHPDPADTDQESGAYLLNTDYTSLALFMKGGDWTVVDDEDDEWTMPNMKGYGMIVTGLQTPEKNVPKTTADYHGEYYYAAIDPDDGKGTFGASGEFNMHANFGSHKLTGTARVADGPQDPVHTTFDATIEGNKFYGTTKRQYVTGMNGQLAGAFYGPNAEEIAGVGIGKAQPENLWGTQGDPSTAKEVDASMVFVGSRQP